MKKSFIIAGLAMIIASCTSELKESTSDSFLYEKVYATVSQDANPETKTDIDLTRTQMIQWSDGDEISLFASSVNERYAFTGYECGNGVFEHISGNTGMMTFHDVYAVYPYSSTSSISDSGISIDFPSVQEYSENSFAPGSAPMIAMAPKSDQLSFRFLPLCGYLRINLWNQDGAKVRRIELKANNGEQLSGKATVYYNGSDEPSITFENDAVSSITLECGGSGVVLGTDASHATEFWLCLPPTMLAKGFTVTLTSFDESKVFQRVISTEKTIERNFVYTMIPIEVSFNQTPVVDHTNSVYYNDFDKVAASQTFGTSGNSWPFLDQFEGWKNQVGTGAVGVSYDFVAMSARNNSNSDGSYSDYAGSGTNNLFFDRNAYFVVKDITLGSGANYTLSFGTEKYAYGVDDNTFNHSEFHVYISNDGAKWVELAYAFPNGDKNGRWDKASSTFTLPAGTSKLSVYFASDLSSAHRLDDVELVNASAAGTAIDFSKGVDLNGGGSGTGDGETGDVEHGATTVSAFVAAAESTTDWYELTGVISNLKDGDKYGNFDLTDDSGSVYVYGVLTEKGGDKQKFQDLVSKYGIANDGTITIKANRGSYNGKVEAVNAFFVSYKAGEGGEGGEGDDDGSGDDGSGEGGDATNEFSSSISWILGTNAYDNTSDKNAQTAIINGKEVNNLLKLGASKAAGDAQLVIPSGTTKIGFYAVGWRGTSVSALRVGDNNVFVVANNGATGNAPYTMTVYDSDYYEIEVSAGNVNVSCDNRVIIFGINPVL